MMKSKELRKEARESLKGNVGKAGGTYLVYMVFAFLLAFVIGLISIIMPPIVNLILELLVSLIIAGILYGCITVLMRIKRKEDVSAFSCISEGFARFWKVFACSFWICVKLLPWILMYVAAIVLSSMALMSGATDNIEQATLSGYKYQLGMIEDEARLEYTNQKGMSAIKGEVLKPYDEWILDTEYPAKIAELEVEIEKLENKEKPVDLSGLYTMLSFVFMIVSIVMLIVRGLRYSLVHFILFDNPDIRARDIVNKSKDLMKGNCGRIFGLGLSFAGWALLAVLLVSITGIIGYIVVMFLLIFLLTPYMQMAMVCFYEELIGANKEEEPINNDFGNSINQNDDPISLI